MEKVMTIAVALRKLDEMKNNGRLLVLTAIGIALVPAMITPVPHGTLGYVVYAEALLGYSVMIGMLLWIASELVTKTVQYRKNAFQAHFGLDHPKSRKEVWIMRYAVDEKLRELACRFHDACSAEEIFLKHSSPTDVTEVKAARTQLDDYQFKIRCAKEEFWHARNIAQLFGFRVRGNATDYWTQPRGR